MSNLSQKRIVLVGGARPNFMKLMPLVRELERIGAEPLLINAGQHYDPQMSGAFMRELDLNPVITLHPTHRSVAEQFAHMMQGLAKSYRKLKPEMVIVVGDVNATLAGALTARMGGIPLAHVEAGLRSRNETMAEERNRIMVDRLSNYLFATEEQAMRNLKREGLLERAHLVGNIMIDSARLILPKTLTHKGKYYFCTLHRAENVDNKIVFTEILDALEQISAHVPIYLPLHPRTKLRAKQFGLMNRITKIFRVLPPLSYTETLGYEHSAALILTDSGGVQEEATYLNVPCLTLRNETERPITVSKGTNKIAGTNRKSILTAYSYIKKHRHRPRARKIPLWDGFTARRIITKLEKFL